MKLYDELLAAGPLIPDPNLGHYDSYDLLVTSVFFDASNVSKYLQRHKMEPGDIPSIKPPFDYTWWETAIPTQLSRRHGAVSYVTSWGNGQRYAIGEEDYSPAVQERMVDEVYWSVWIDAAPIPANDSAGRGPVRGGLLRKVMYEIGIPMDELGRPFIDKDGQIVARDLSANRLLHGRSGPGSYEGLLGYEQSGQVPGFSVADWRRGLIDHGMQYIWPFLVAIGFSHCKNVEMVEAPELPYKVRRKQELKIGKPLVKFKELVIDPSTSQKRYTDSQQPNDGEKIHKSLHIVRGHFATYGDENKLFGRLTGTFWKPAHTRGSDEIGAVYKDYRVKANNADREAPDAGSR